MACDIGHYESEFYTQRLIYSILKEKFSKLAVRLTGLCTNQFYIIKNMAKTKQRKYYSSEASGAN